MAKKPKQVLEENWVSPSSNIEKSSIKMTIKQDHSNPSGQYGQGS
jgi:hypothetical protein